jgi:surface antigen
MRVSRLLLAAATATALGAVTTAPAQASGGEPQRPGKHCTSTSKSGTKASKYNRTPTGSGPWKVPLDPCNTEGTGATDTPYDNCAYWAAEKRPDVWVKAVWKYGYSTKKPGAWRIKADAHRAGYSINHRPQAGDIAAWGRNAAMGHSPDGVSYTASPGGHVAYVENVASKAKIVMSSMGTGVDGGVTTPLVYDKKHTFFIHHM